MSIHYAYYHKRIQYCSGMKWRCSFKNLPLPPASECLWSPPTQQPKWLHTLQISSRVSRAVSPGRTTVRAGWLFGRQNQDGVKYSWTQMSQSGLCWWTAGKTIPSRIRNKVSRAASQSLRVSDPLVAHGDYLRKGPGGKSVVAVVKDRGDSQREQEIIEKGAFWGCTRCLRWDADLTPDPWHPQVGTAWLSGYQTLAERKKQAIRSAQLSCYDFFHKPISNLELRVLWQDDVPWWAVSFKGDQEAPRKFLKMVFQHKLLTTRIISVLTFNLWHSSTRDRELRLLYEVQRTPQMSFLPFLRLLPSVHPLNRGIAPSF